ncbi:5'-nucleotidase C-terminal domain-containing protein [Streptomyces sp. CB01881]|uniref:bifunctional metallophosphatase/5'-nucleotidase n=1 Tax=Streptomyces sp. CB01881 TaxID=2078691 RepID=UPI000CDC4D81|nr:5'-nucleotidase C-terminal domain-containing protein [Streptomyces sp. CB01881]AUY52198.1 bifunctional metallophosphatase/5'-nucleotidase [Streptomyces sp. CB01881]TYC71625.1 bifunctional metallophosphatase/5'-nucleotidase [Streptomyces sp. CB01881]
MSLNRRDFVTRSAATAAGAALAGGASLAAASPAAAAGPDDARAKGKPAKKQAFTVMGTTDLHGRVLNWDYFTDAVYADKAHNEVGLAKISSLAKQVREEKGWDRCLLIDAGDIIQGTQLTYYFARVEPIATDADTAPEHPMALAMNLMEYDAAALGNHEFNYGIPTLRAFEEQLDFPLLGANALHAKDEKPAFKPFVIKELHLGGGRPLKVGILGLTNPGIAIWDKANVAGKMVFPGIVEMAKKYVPRMKAAGADIIVVSAHSGIDEPTTYGDQLPWPEDASGEMAETVPDIDAVLVGHTHKEVAQRLIVNKQTGKTVVLSEPLCWGQRLTCFDFEVEFDRGAWKLVSLSSRVLNSNTVPEDPEIANALADQHKKVVAYVNQPIGTCKAELSIAESRFKDTPIIDLIGRVQADVVREALAGGQYAKLPVLAQAAPFNRTALIPAGQVKLRDAAGLYIYENTLEARILTGAQIKDYLEYSAKYYVQVAPGAPIDKDTLTNAQTTPDYNYDAVYGVSYDIDISQPVGSRIVNLSFDGKPIDPAAQFVLAVNNYRANGGGNFPHVAKAQKVWANSDEIRNAMIAWVKAKGVIDPADFAGESWRLVRVGQPVF